MPTVPDPDYAKLLQEKGAKFDSFRTADGRLFKLKALVEPTQAEKPAEPEQKPTHGEMSARELAKQKAMAEAAAINAMPNKTLPRRRW